MKHKSVMTPFLVGSIIASTVVISVLYYFIGTRFFDSPLTYYQYLKLSSLIAVMVVGGYQLFFWVQRNNYYFPLRYFNNWFDDLIPFWPSWIWLYSFFYYAMIGYFIVTIKSIDQAFNLMFGGLVLLVIQCCFFMLFPSKVPSSWRQYEVNTISRKFLRLVQTMDNGRNCFPSMHISLTTYVALAIHPEIGGWAYFLIALISVSTLLVKQHPIFDVLPGILVGWFVYWLIF